MAFTAQQQLALDIIPRITAMMSILGSSFIIYEVLKNPKKRVMAYHLQVLALSINNFLFSTAWIIYNWPAPDSGWCTTRGFLDLLTGTSEAMLSAGVCVYYLFFVYFAWSEEKILRYQRVLIIFPIIWGLITAILTLAQGMINPGVTGECWLELAPAGCTGSECTPDEYYYHLYRFVFIDIPAWVSFGVAFISMCCVYYKVSKDEREQGGQAPTDSWLWFVQREEGQDTSRAMRSRRMARQAFWFLLNFFLTYVGATAWDIVYASGSTPSFGLFVFVFMFRPWQGFWNAIIYIRPRYMRNREKYPDMSIWQAIMTEDEYDHRLGSRAMRSTVAPTAPNFTASFYGSILRMSVEVEGQGQGESQGESQGEGQGAEAEAEVELAQVYSRGGE
jgi:hypothetical protein